MANGDHAPGTRMPFYMAIPKDGASSPSVNQAVGGDAPGPVTINLYEGSVQRPVSTWVPLYTFLLHDLLMHSSAGDALHGYHLTLQQGHPQHPGSGAELLALLKGMHGVRRAYARRAEDEIQTAGSDGQTDEVKDEDEGSPPIATDNPSYPKFYRSKTGGLVRVNRSRTGKIYTLRVNRDKFDLITRAMHKNRRTPFQPRTILEDTNSYGTREVSPNDVYNTAAWLKANGLIATVAGGMCETTSPNLLRAVHQQFMELPLYECSVCPPPDTGK